jgi:hypothetical protein
MYISCTLFFCTSFEKYENNFPQCIYIYIYNLKYKALIEISYIWAFNFALEKSFQVFIDGAMQVWLVHF